MFIQTEATPNPASLKFIPGRVVMKEKTAYFKNEKESVNSPFGKRLFNIDGVDGIFFGSDFITITKNELIGWEVLKPLILSSIMDHYKSGDETIDQQKTKKKNFVKDTDESEIVKQIKELLDTRVRPAVAMDGGDIVFDSFEKGIVYLHMQGACSGCPSSTATLKTGIENILKHYIPEVIEVRASSD